MALAWVIQKESVQQDVSSANFTDQTVYGTGGNPARNQRANFLFFTRTDVGGARTLLTDTPGSADPLVVASWNVLTPTDGLIEKIIFSLSLFDAGATYNTGDIFYYSTDGNIYKTKQDGVTGQTPPNATFYDEISKSDLYNNEIDNDTAFMERVFLNDIVSGRVEDNLNDLYEKDSDEFMENKQSILQITLADRIEGLLTGAYSAVVNERPLEAERIIRAIENHLETY